MMNRKRKARIANLIGKIFIILLFLVMIINVIVPDREESELENRALEQRPRFNLTTILSGDFMEQWEKYLSDQFAGRDTWRSLKVSLDRLGGARKENDIYIGKDGQLMEDIEVPDDGRLEANLTAIRDFAETYEDISVTMMLVPDAACILSDSLPAFARVEDQRQMFSMAERKLGDTVNWVDTVSILNNHKSEKLYYKTDHHWTTQGAFYVFQDAAETLGIEGDVSDDFVSYTVTDSFNGVLAASSGVGLDEMEQIDIYAPTGGDDDVVVNYVDEGRKTTSLYDSSKLETRDKYGVFLGGNTSVVDIRTVSTSQKRLLVVKDSFADCFIPFLAPYYREIVVVDPRYYSGTMQDIMDSYRITDALILYSGNTFFTDNNISGVFTGE
ncbi:DHHW family protein [Mediterraneibacter glycyrrhizinilyticus]|uniref:DHHW family protein n=1 Tax=Mediterraneibacter glycyrrhizinilyticus TaxID=342942 RepID=UPI0025A360A6|nr:DHHW family protein [Mediterraneibacter glycyrrhizinilyticus]MDM8124991.1 DHHW family protein [Mediterraneibacter glycyrrhizinilyticus]